MKSVNSYSKSKLFTLINIAKCTEANFQIQDLKLLLKAFMKLIENDWIISNYKF